MNRRLEVIGVACHNCVGACCKAGTALTLTDDEVYKNKRQMQLARQLKARSYPQGIALLAEGFDEQGNKIPIPMPIRVPAFYGLYLLAEDCGHLTPDHKCDIYGKRERPRVSMNMK